MGSGGLFSSPSQGNGGSERVGTYCCIPHWISQLPLQLCPSRSPDHFPFNTSCCFSHQRSVEDLGVWRVHTYRKLVPDQQAQDLAKQWQEERRGTTWSRAWEYIHHFCLRVLWINSWSLPHLGNWKQLAHHFCFDAFKTLDSLSVAWVSCVTSYSLLSIAPQHLRALWTIVSFL